MYVCRWPCFFHEHRPLFALVSPAGGAAFAVLGLHLKSKGIFDAREWSRCWDTADANREKILAQATPKDKQELDVSSIHTTSFKDPIFNAGAHQDARRLGHLYKVQARVGSFPRVR